MDQPIIPEKSDRKAGGTGNTLATSVYDRMRADILTGKLPPGDKLRSEFLRARYDVGTSPMREALNRLGRFDEALQALERATVLQPQNAKAFYTLGHLYDRKHMGEEAALMYRRARELSRE